MVWERIRDTVKDTFGSGHPSWCNESDCYFYESDWCIDCNSCAYCGASLGHRGRNKQKAHLFIPESRGGRTWIPTCMNCNQSQGQKGLKTWLRWLHENNRRLYDEITEYHADMTMTPSDTNVVHEKVLEIYRELG